MTYSKRQSKAERLAMLKRRLAALRVYKLTCTEMEDDHGERDAVVDIEVIKARIDELENK